MTASRDVLGHRRGSELLARLDRIPIWALPRTYLAIIGLGYFFVFLTSPTSDTHWPAIMINSGLTGSEGVFVAVRGRFFRLRSSARSPSDRWPTGSAATVLIIT